MNISIVQNVQDTKDDLETQNLVSHFTSVINQNSAESHFLRQEETKKTEPPIVRAPKFLNPVEGDFPCMHIPLPAEPFLFLFVCLRIVFFWH